MTLKTLLLGSAAAFAVVGGAQAADLSVAEPVESVKVCDYFGQGYFYIPGTDTCLKVGGSVKFQLNLHDLATTYTKYGPPYVGASNTANGTYFITSDAAVHDSNYDFVTEGKINFTAKSVTDIGSLEGFVSFKGSLASSGSSTDGIAKLDNAWLKVGALKVGVWDSLWDAYPYADYSGSAHAEFIGNFTTQHLELSMAAAGLTLALSVEDPRGTWGTSLPDNWSMPMIIGKVGASAGSVSGDVRLAYVELDSNVGDGYAYGLQGNLGFTLTPTDKLSLNGVYGDGKFVGGGANGANDGYSGWVSFQHMFSSTVTGAVDLSYLNPAGDTADDEQWSVGGDLIWTPYTGFSANLFAGYFDSVSGSSSIPSSWKAQVALKRSW